MTANKIISFSLWGSDPKYLVGAVENVRLQKIHYPDWKCRFYLDHSVTQEIVNTLMQDAEVHFMPESKDNFGLFWRFSPLDDGTVDRFIVRDTDSRLNAREAAAVAEWEQSGKWFHIMRDHPYHMSIPICGAMWGATSEFRPGYSNMVNDWLARNAQRIESGGYFGTDQMFLTECIYPLIKDNHIAHESIPSNYGNDNRVFAVTNPDNMFVGQQIKENGEGICY
jgi:hypothetical protein